MCVCEICVEPKVERSPSSSIYVWRRLRVATNRKSDRPSDERDSIYWMRWFESENFCASYNCQTRFPTHVIKTDFIQKHTHTHVHTFAQNGNSQSRFLAGQPRNNDEMWMLCGFFVRRWRSWLHNSIYENPKPIVQMAIVRYVSKLNAHPISPYTFASSALCVLILCACPRHIWLNVYRSALIRPSRPHTHTHTFAINKRSTHREL